MVGGARGGGGGVKAGEGSSPGNSIFLQGPWFDQLVTCVHSPDLGYGNTSLVIVFVYRRHSANWVYYSKMGRQQGYCNDFHAWRLFILPMYFLK